ncbi:MAG: helix-turn-helix domain-containing protein [Xanthomonadaceae bacterium]|nr:helix-turn-helix domain-containing protein [Xanthomonadaceae bacterium]
MDSLISAGARALAAGDPIGALKLVALRNDAAGLALRGIALAQLGEYGRARELLRAATRAFSVRETVARARCIVAEAEIALASRDLGFAPKTLESARATLEAHGDTANAAHARLLTIQRLLLLGNVEEAQRALAELHASALPPALQAARALIAAGIAMRRVRASEARAALARADRAARTAGIAALVSEVRSAKSMLDTPVARLLEKGSERLLLLDEVESLLASSALIVDGCRYVVRQAKHVVSLARRPILLALAHALARAWPHDVPRDALVARAFRLALSDESHRARLRVEIGRLRKLLEPIAAIEATRHGFALAPRRARNVVVLARPVEDKYADVLALLADGESWSTSALALALGSSQRTVQRALESLARAGKVQAFGLGRARRWATPPLPGFTTVLLLPASLPTD